MGLCACRYCALLSSFGIDYIPNDIRGYLSILAEDHPTTFIIRSASDTNLLVCLLVPGTSWHGGILLTVLRYFFSVSLIAVLQDLCLSMRFSFLPCNSAWVL